MFRRYAPSAMALARRVARQPFLAEEIVQEAFLAVWRNPGSEAMAVTIEPSSCPDAPTTDPILTAEVTA
ncbi:MAG: sigma factor [Actinomycetota bacterium]